MSPGVYIAELLCPARHCMVAVANFCETDEEVEALRKTADGILQAANSARAPEKTRCVKCRSELQVETSRTPFNSMEEAEPYLEARAAQQYLEWNLMQASRN
jgi:hypothetical protein